MIYKIQEGYARKTLLFFFQNKVRSFLRSFIVCWVYQNILLLAMANGTFFMGALVFVYQLYQSSNHGSWIMAHGTKKHFGFFVPPSRCEVCGHVIGIARHRFIPVGHGSTAWSRTDIIQDLKIRWYPSCESREQYVRTGQWHPFRFNLPRLFDQHKTKTRYWNIIHLMERLVRSTNAKSIDPCCRSRFDHSWRELPSP